MDLIILALIAGFIVYRLYITLGEKTGYKGDNKKAPSNVVDFNAPRGKEPLKAVHPAKTEEVEPAFRQAVQYITKKDPDFSLGAFKEGAVVAFEMILEAYAAGDISRLKKLLSPDLYKAFKSAVDERAQKGQTLENTLIRVEKVLIEDISVQNNRAQIRLHYTTEQVPVLKDKDGEIIEGSPNQIDQVMDTWTFERSLKSRDPNWLLVSTEI